MDAGMTIAPVSGVAAGNSALPAANVAQGAVTTDLPDSQAITPAAGTSSTPDGGPQSPTASPSSLGQFTVDPQTREVLFRLVDTRTQQVIQQVPDQAMLRSQAYAIAIQNGATPFRAAIQADLET